MLQIVVCSTAARASGLPLRPDVHNAAERDRSADSGRARQPIFIQTAPRPAMLILRATVWCIGRVEIEQNPRPRWVGSLLDDGGPTFGAALLECSPVLDGGDVASCCSGPVAGVTQYGLPCCGCGLGTWRDRMIRLGWSAAVSPPASAESGPRRSARPSREPSGARAARETGPARVSMRPKLAARSSRAALTRHYCGQSLTQ